MLDGLTPEELRQHFGENFPDQLSPLLAGDHGVKQEILALLSGLRRTDAQVLTCRLNLDEKGFRTLEETGQQLGKKREIVRQQQNRGLNGLKQLLDAGYIRPLATRVRQMGSSFPCELAPLLSNTPSAALKERVLTVLQRLSADERAFIIARLNLDGKGFRTRLQATRESGGRGWKAYDLQERAFSNLKELMQGEHS